MAEQDIIQSVHQAMESVPHTAHSQTPHELPNIVTLLNNFFPDAAWSQFLHRWENIFFACVAAVLICVVAIRAAREKRAIPAGIQNFVEAVAEAIETFVTSILGEQGRKHVPFIGTVFIYILFMNLSGLVPLMKSPTSTWSTTLAVALTTMIYIQIAGIQEQGFGNYVRHMAGNPRNLLGVLLIPLMLTSNLLIETVALPFSLSLRLFANISSEDRLLFRFAELNVLFKGLPFLLQILVNILAIALSLVQAFIFTLLSTVYLALATTHEDHEATSEPDSQAIPQAH